MSMELIVLLCVAYAAVTLGVAAFLQAREFGEDMAVGFIALLWPAYLAIILVTYPVSRLGRWVAKIGGWR